MAKEAPEEDFNSKFIQHRRVPKDKTEKVKAQEEEKKPKNS